MRNWGTEELIIGQDDPVPRHEYNRQSGSSLSHYAILPSDGQSGIAAAAHHRQKHDHVQVRGNKNSHLYGVSISTEKKQEIKRKN